MSDHTLAKVVQDLKTEEARIVEKVAALRKECEREEADLKRVRDALSALGERGSRKKKSPTKEDVLLAAATVLSENKVLKESELKELVGAQLEAAGKTRMGIALRLQEAQKQGLLEKTLAGFRLPGEKPAGGASSGASKQPASS